jgi:hypothetical protein
MPKKRGRPRKKPIEEPVETEEPQPDVAATIAAASPPETSPGEPGKPSMTSIQLTPAVRDRLWKLKFRKTYDAFLAELCEMYEAAHKEQ